MATLFKIKSTVTGLEQEVTQEQLDVLKANGWKGTSKQVETAKTAKAPEEVAKKK